ncbi:MAG: transcription elongation factor GreA [Sulfuricaulis sp.]|nr:transcription elongation factor GreA [Sulfuricaulis sp.]
MKKTPMTISGSEQMKLELHRLKTVERPRIIQAIAEARAHGDLSENAEYHAAKEQQGFVEGRIADLDMKLSTAQIIDPKTVNANDRVVFGATLNLRDEAASQEVIYQIVGDFEANIAQGKISISSPIARALIGKELGDMVEVQVPGGVRSYEILDIRYV